MKLPITDEFLLTLYRNFEKIIKINPFPRSFKEAATDYKWLRKMYEEQKRKTHFSHFLIYLKKKGYIKIEKLKERKAVLLTPKGKDKALKAKLLLLEEEFKNSKLKKRRDDKLLMVIFDIPEDKRRWRDALRGGLVALGYAFFQKSVWISPFDVYTNTEKLVEECNLDRFVRIFLIEKVDSSI